MIRERVRNGAAGIPVLLLVIVLGAADVYFFISGVRAEDPLVIGAASLFALVLAFIGAGFFTADPVGGYPAGEAVEITATGVLHQLFSAGVFLGLPAASGNPPLGVCPAEVGQPDLPVRTTWLAPGLTVAVMVFVSAVVLAIVPVATPKASVRPGWTSVLLLPVLANCTAWPATGLPLVSRTVTVIVEIAAPFAMTPVAGDAVAVVRTALMLFGSATNVTDGCCASTTSPAPGLTVAVMVFVSAVVVAIVPVATPF